MNSSFNDLPWHDATLMEILIDRRQAGVRDNVRLEVTWPDGQPGAVTFSDCYAMQADLNFGVVAEEQIASAVAIEDHVDVIGIRDRWSPLGVSLQGLRCYQLETSSTGSVIRIFAMRFEIT
jgi:hypothetical protein